MTPFKTQQEIENSYYLIIYVELTKVIVVLLLIGASLYVLNGR